MSKIRSVHKNKNISVRTENEKVDNAWYFIGWIAIAAVLCYLIVSMMVGGEFLRFPYPCMINLITGYYCPGCGGTRAMHALFSGHIIKSFLYHPLVPYVAVLCGWFMISQTIERLTKGKVKIAMHFREIYLWLALVIIVLNCLIKNLMLGIFGIDLLNFR